MRAVRILLIGIGALPLAACTALTGPRQIGIGGGTGARVLAFTTQPSNAFVGTEIAPAVQVAVRDTLGVVDTLATGAVTVALGTNPTGATLSGTTTVTLVSGVATFVDLTVNLAGTGYTLRATSTAGGVAAVTSAAFDITPAP
jgi:hypothetical protein